MTDNLLPRGVYLGLPFEDYLAEPSLSASGIKALMTSPLTYWAQCLDPNREDKSTPSKSMGRALHKMILEGTAAFDEAYAIAPIPEEYPDCLQGVEALRAKCAELGLKKSGTLMEMSERILEIDPGCILWPVIKDEFQEELAAGNREIVSRDVYAQCMRAFEAITANDAARIAISSGLPEVSVFWKDINGVPMKSRLDYLKPKAILDLKSFSNSSGAPLDRAVARAMATYKYHVQAYIYTQAAKAAKAMILQGHVFGNNPANLQQFADQPHDPRFFFIFLETGAAPNVLVREVTQTQGDVVSMLWESGKRSTVAAIETWQVFMDKYGRDNPWRENQQARAFQDEEFPIWMVE